MERYRRRHLNRRSLVLLVVAHWGCTVYAPLDTDPPPAPGTQVRVNLTTPGAVRISDLLGRPLRSLEGSLVDWTGDSLSIGLISATEWGRPWDAVDTLRVAQTELSLLEEKRVDPTRTGILVAGSAVVVGATVVALFNAAGWNEDTGGGEPPDVILSPLFSFIH